MRLTAAVAVFSIGCSFVGVRGPADRIDPLPDDPRSLSCTDHSILPTLDVLGGAGALITAGAGVILEQTSEDGEPENFTLYFAGPLVATAVVYWWSASRGNTKLTWCSEAKEAIARRVGPSVTPIDQQSDTEVPHTQE